MTLAASAISQPARYAVAPTRSYGSDSNRVLGTFKLQLEDLEDGGTFAVRTQYRTGAHLGARDGYETLGAAIRDMSRHTADVRGMLPAAAVLERNDRYFGYRMKGRDLAQGTAAWLAPEYLETDNSVRTLSLEAEKRFDRLRAIVDGDFVRRFPPAR